MNPESPLTHAKHVFRAAILLLVVLIAMVLGRSLFVPETWGDFGPYRGAAVAEHRDKPIRHGGNDSCGMCHDVEYADHAAGVHATVQCELCHGPVALHADLEEGEMLAEMPVRRSRELCELCHRHPHRFDNEETPWQLMTKRPLACQLLSRAASSSIARAPPLREAWSSP
jgi:hypothetical protein